VARRTTRGDRGDSGWDRPPVRLVDRVEEMRLLRGELARVVGEGRCRAVLVVGESGIGKSRLLAEFLTEAGQGGVRVLTARCIGQGGEPLLPVKEALADHLGRSPDRIRRSLLTAAPWLLDFVPFVGSFLGRLGEEVLSGGKLGGGGQGLYEGVSRVLLGIAEKTGLLLAVEDLHAADPDTLYFLNYLLPKASTSKLLAVFTVQEEQLRSQPLAELLDQWRKQGHQTLPVPPLPRAHVREFLAVVAGRNQVVDEPIAERFYRLTGGNPFFLQESVGWFDQHRQGRLDQPADWDPGGPVARIESVLHHRLAAVDEDTRRFLDAASVVLQTSEELDAVA
jgi:predicted ATPase